MKFERVVKLCHKNIEYYAYYVSCFSSLHKDDAKQEILIRMWKASRKYDKKLSQRKTYFINVIKKEMMRLIKIHKDKDKRFGKLVCLYDFVDDDKQLMDIIKDERVDVEKDAMIKDILDRIENSINDKKIRKVFRLMRIGFTITEIEKKMKISRQNINGHLKRKIRVNKNLFRK